MLFAGLGVFLAYAMYRAKWLSPEKIAAMFRPFYDWAYQKYYFDHLYENLFVKNFLMRWLFNLLQKFDSDVIDGAVNGLANITVGAGKGVRRWQTGQLQLYGLFIGIGVVIIVIVVFAVG